MTNLLRITKELKALVNEENLESITVILEHGVRLVVSHDPLPPVFPKTFDMPRTDFVTERDSGVWISWRDWQARDVPNHDGKLVHAITFSNGMVWDAMNGWRPPND